MEEIGLKISQYEDGLWALDDGVCRAYLVTGAHSALLLDTGMGVGDIVGAVTAVTDKPLIVANSHGHLDHVAGNDLFEDIYIHPADAAIIETTARLHPLKEGDVFDLGGRSLEALELPGHSEGSVAFIERSQGYILTGDFIQSHPILLQCETSDTAHYLASLKKLLTLDGIAERLYPSHGDYPLDMAYVRKVLDCAEDYMSGSRPSEPFNLVIPGKNIWTRAYTRGDVTLVVGPNTTDADE